MLEIERILEVKNYWIKDLILQKKFWPAENSCFRIKADKE